MVDTVLSQPTCPTEINSLVVFYTGYGVARFCGTTQQTIEGSEIQLISLKLTLGDGVIHLPRTAWSQQDQLELVTSDLANAVVDRMKDSPSTAFANSFWQGGRGAEHYGKMIRRANALGFAEIFADLNRAAKPGSAQDGLRRRVGQELIELVTYGRSLSAESAKQQINDILDKAGRPRLPDDL